MRIQLVGDEGIIELERFGNVWVVWEYYSNNLEENLEIKEEKEVEKFIAYWRNNGYPEVITVATPPSNLTV